MNKIRVIIKEPGDAYGKEKLIENSLETIQGIIDGYMETVSIQRSPDLIMICNEEGKLRHLPWNIIMGNTYKDVICGTLILCGRKDAEFADVPISLQQWERIMVGWGN